MSMMDIETGNIIAASKGEGKSKSSYVKAGSKPFGMIRLGTYHVTQDSVYNAVQKASYAAVDQLLQTMIF